MMTLGEIGGGLCDGDVGLDDDDLDDEVVGRVG